MIEEGELESHIQNDDRRVRVLSCRHQVSDLATMVYDSAQGLESQIAFSASS